jgi:hypothetical protein
MQQAMCLPMFLKALSGRSKKKVENQAYHDEQIRNNLLDRREEC